MVDERRLREVALTPEEYRVIVEELEASPERGRARACSACSGRSTARTRARRPCSAACRRPVPAVLQGPGENAGAVDIGEGWAAVFKIESHNHPSAIEPYQGAATGVGGIIRDVIAMGARPIALLDSLRFGPLPASSHHVEGVVAGIGGYGNCIGIPTVGGEVYFDDCYASNPLVNAMCVGLVPRRSADARPRRGHRQQPDARRRGHRPRRHPRRVVRLARARRDQLRAKAGGAGGQPVSREVPARGVHGPRAHRRGGRDPGPRRCRPHVLGGRVRGPGGGRRRAHRRRAGAAARARHDARTT